MSNSISREDKWLAQLERYKKYCDDKDSLSSKEKKSLNNWIYKQRMNHSAGKLSEDRTEKLNAIGFLMKPGAARQLAWDSNVAKAKTFIDEYGHNRFKDVDTVDANKLSNWLKNTTQRKRDGKLTEEQIKGLDDIGIDLGLCSNLTSRWDTSFKEFKAYLDANPYDNELLQANKRLRCWYQAQRIAHNKQRLKKKRLEQFIINDIPLDLSEARFKNKLNQLAAYYSEYGNYIVSCKNEVDKKWPGLHNWVERIIKQFNSGKLSEEIISKLNKIGFEWLSYTAMEQWESMFEELMALYAKSKHIDPPKETLLHTWIQNQRVNYKQDKLLPSQIERLKGIGFQFDLDFKYSTDNNGMSEDKWNANLAKAKDFISKHGHFDLRAAKDVDPVLINWASYIHYKIRFNKLPKGKITELERAGISISISTQENNWNTYFQELQDYMKESPNDKRAYKANKKLKDWAYRQRSLFSSNHLPTHREELLRSIGFVLEFARTRWDERFEQLKLVLANNQELNPGLKSWLKSQKERYNNHKLPEAKSLLLKSIGVELNYQSNVGSHKKLQQQISSFEKHLNQLEEFYETHKHFEITKDNSAQWPGLLSWASNQKDRFAEGLLFESQIEKLNELGFVLRKRSFFEKQWDDTINKANEFFAEHGHYNFKAFDNDEAKSLNRWIQNLRKRAKKNEVPQERIMQLEAMGIELSLKTNQDKWNEKILELTEYISMNPDDHNVKKANKTLKNWVDRQLQNYRDDSLSQGRVNTLIASGINLSNKRDLVFSLRLAKLKEYHTINGHCRVTQKDNIEWPGLAGWVGHIRAKFREGKLSEKDFSALDKLGFNWNTVIT